MNLHHLNIGYKIDPKTGSYIRPEVKEATTYPVDEGAVQICSCCGAVAYTEDPTATDAGYATSDQYVGITPPWPGIVIAGVKIGEEGDHKDGQYTVNHINCKAGVLTVSIQNFFNGDWKEGIRPEENGDYDNPF